MSFMQTPMFNNFEYPIGRVQQAIEPGIYHIKVNYGRLIRTK